MRPNNRQRSRGGRNGGGGGGGGGHHNKPQHHNPNRPPNRNQLFDSSGPDVRVRGNAHQVFDKYQALAREAATSGDRILAEAYWQYADHYFRMIQTMGGFGQRNNQGWGDGGEEGQAPPQQQQGQGGQPTIRPTPTGMPRATNSGRAAVATNVASSRMARPSPVWAASLSSRAAAARPPTTIRRPTSSPRSRSSRQGPAAAAAEPAAPVSDISSR